MTMLGCAVASVRNGLRGIFSSQPADQFSLVFFASAFLGDSSSAPSKVSQIISSARISCTDELWGRMLWLDKSFS